MPRGVARNIKMDVALTPQTISNTNVTGRYYRLGDTGGRRVAFLLSGGALVATKTCKLEVLQATDESGTSSKVISATDNAEKTLTANTKVVEATAAIGSIENTDVVTVNGVDFTKAAAEDTDANDFDDGDSLASQINSDVPNVVASFDTNTLTVRSKNGVADVTLEKTENSGTITLATTAYQIYVEISEEDLDLENSFYYVAPKVTNDDGSGSITSVAALRIDGRTAPSQIGVGKVQ